MKRKIINCDIITDLISVDFDIMELSKKLEVELHIAHAKMSARVYKKITGRELTNNDRDISITFEPFWTININGINVGFLKVGNRKGEVLTEYYIEFMPNKTNQHEKQ